MNPRWYRDAIVYQVDPSLFRDATGDGWGDLKGITARLDYLRGLGVNCLWLMPFYPSPFRDGGYDICDYLAVDPRFGDLADMAALLDRADELGIRVLIELVMQHTSDRHGWFREACADRGSRFRDYYVWADEPPDDGLESVFPTVEDGVWTWHEQAQQHYRHMFYAHEPDLNLANPAVREELYRVMSFWLRLGVAGFRVDAVPYMIERARAGDARDDGFWLLEEMRDFVAERRPEAVLLGEVDVDPEEYARYFGRGNRLTLLLDFWINNHVFLALARQDARPIAHALAHQPVPPEHAQYAHWLRNHDELDLGRLSQAERDEVMRAFAPDENMRAYHRGIRRRLAPMLGGDQRRLAMTHAILFSLPGAPIVRYGDEIGMGDDLSLPERQAVRTPMQWSDDRNAGFSSVADASRLPAPVIDEGPFDYRRLNAHEQLMRDGSLLLRTREMARVRTGLQEISFGRCTALDLGDSRVLALRHEARSVVLMLANLSAEALSVELRDAELGDLVDLLSDSPYEDPQTPPCRVTLQGYGYRWLCPRDHLFG